MFFNAGVKIYEGTSVNHVVVDDGHVIGVETDRGHIECEYFVNCAGQVSKPDWLRIYDNLCISFLLLVKLLICLHLGNVV